MEVRIGGVAPESIVDGPGLRYTVFFQGCAHNCPGCHNPQTHDYNGGHISDTDKLIEKIEDNPLLDGVTFSGGEPFDQPAPLFDMAKKLKDKGYSTFAYTGYLFENLLKAGEEKPEILDALSCIDVLIDGPFLLSERSLELRFKGSKNQRVLDCRESLKQGKAVVKEL